LTSLVVEQARAIGRGETEGEPAILAAIERIDVLTSELRSMLADEERPTTSIATNGQNV
jgi:hypothetical protein